MSGRHLQNVGSLVRTEQLSYNLPFARKSGLEVSGTPDMGGVSADGRVLWLTGRYSGVVYAISTRSGRLLAKIPVGSGPHGLCVWPQPGRYSLGHTGILR